MVIKKIYILIVFLVLLSFVNEDEAKGSVTFVIDDTKSMRPEIEQVKARTDDIFEAVLKSNTSQIDEFIIVTFNDPHVSFQVKTNDRLEFGRALSEIRPHGGGDCPEMAMAGIKLALDESKPNSFLYVYTDASAADYLEYENVKSLAQKKSIQVNFLLTGECRDPIEELHTVYDRIAAATSGQVFHIDKDEISKIIEYILTNLRSKRTILLRRTYKYRCDDAKFSVDSKVWEILIALSAPRPLSYNDFIVYGPDGNKASIQGLIYSQNTVIVKMDCKPGEYSIAISDCDEITVLVSASTSVSFQHGFSSAKPSCLDETSTKPVSGKKSHLAIALTNEERDITLKTVEIRDMDDNLIPPVLPLKLIDDEKQFYITDLFFPPQKTFTIAVNGYTKSNEKITRTSQTSIEYHKPTSEERTKKTPPTVTIIGPKEVPAEYHKSVVLKCKVYGFPKPQIWWEDEFYNDMPAKVNEIAPHEYISILHIYKVTNNIKFICKAKNYVENSDYVTVTVENKLFLNVLEYPKDKTVEFGDRVELNVKVDAKPPATICWYQGNTEINNNEDMEIITYSEGSSLKIKSAKPSLEGKYSVIASNGHKKEKHEFEITVTTKKKAAKVTILGKNEVTAYVDQPITLNCKVEGFPKPSITWEDQYHNVLASKITEITPPYEYISTLQIDKATESGTYFCIAKNFEDDSGSVKVTIEQKTFFNVLEYPKDVAVEYGKSVQLNFKIDAMPPAKIIWYQDDKEIRSNDEFDISIDNYFLKIKNAQPRMQGKYFVKASNIDNQVEYEFYVTVTGTEVPKIYKHTNSYTKLKELSVDIECRIIQGSPEPLISWSFDRDSSGKFIHLKETGETVHIDHVTKNDVGTYRCEVSNIVGADNHEMQLYIEYPPTIKIDPSKDYDCKKGEQVKLSCEVDGSPIPEVHWFVDEREILEGRKYKIYRDHTLSFAGSIGDSGKYVCEASNYLKTVRAEVTVFIYEPINIKPPEESKCDVKLRSRLVLSCNANGYPKPTVQWFHYPTQKNTKIKSSGPKKLDFDENYNVILDKIQPEDEGFYECTAFNDFDSDKLTYTVNVQVPAAIIPNLVTNDVNVVEGDLNFILTCIATGSPKPTITWQHDGIKIGSERGFEISKDGSLTVNNVISRHKGTYTCTAQNAHSKDTMNYEVYVHPFPPFNDDALIITIIEGETKHDMYCGMVLEKDFLVRWFKDGAFKTTGDLALIDVTKADAGYYTCRLSTPGRSYSFHKRVIVGTEPKFITADNPTIMFKNGADARLDCSATGEPPPRIKWWYDYIKIDEDSAQYSFRMNINHIGQYMCSVSNEFGTIKRSFDIIAGECLMNLENDFTARQPMLVTGKRKRQWPIFNLSGGTLRMQKYRQFTLFCPNSFISYDNSMYGRKLETSCVGDSLFELRGKAIKVSEITCDQPIVPLAKTLIALKCLGRNTKLFHVGFDLDGSFMAVFSVCFNEMTKMPIFVKHSMHKAIAGTIPKHIAGYTKGTVLNFEFEEIYDCRNQMDAISLFIGKTVGEKCCFKRRQLVNPMDVLPGIPQVATYHYLNVVPQWSSCGTENWDEVERRVRLYAINSEGIISIWTGAAYSVRKNVPAINLKDKLDQEIQVPQFIWKVVEQQLAIIHINVPLLTSSQALPYILCYDICDTVHWMSNAQWHDVDKGFIYCCTIKEFERAFNYQYVFFKHTL